MNNGKNENDEQLLYGIEPDSIYTTDDVKYPIKNRLTLHIANPESAPARTFVNDQGLTPDDDLPGIDSEVDAEYNLSRFFIWFPWGEKEGDLCTLEQSGNITVSPGPHNDSWYVVRMSDSTIGTYWILFPKEQTALQPEESVTFVLDNIITTANDGLSWMHIKNQKILDYEDGSRDEKVLKKTPELEIRSFHFDPGTIAMKGESTLHWETIGAQSCLLDPGNEKVECIGQKKVSTDHDTVYTFRAQCGDRIIDRDARLYVGNVEISSFECNPRQLGKKGDKVELRWETKYASSCKIDPHIGQVEPSGTIEVTPEKPTEYTLVCEGKGGPLTHSAKVETLWVRIVKFEIEIHWEWRGRSGDYLPYPYVVWETDKAATCELCRLEPSKEISKEPRGSIEVLSQAATYRLTCEGPEGPISEEVIYSGDPNNP